VITEPEPAITQAEKYIRKSGFVCITLLCGAIFHLVVASNIQGDGDHEQQLEPESDGPLPHKLSCKGTAVICTSVYQICAAAKL
jgi:hypothetical protein